MAVKKMYYVGYEKNGKYTVEFLMSDGLETIIEYIQKTKKPHGIISAEVAYEVGDIIEVKDEWAEDDSRGTIKKAIIVGFADDGGLRVEMGWEYCIIYARDEYKVIGKVPVCAEGYIDDWETARKIVREAA